jgi:hypothetical protein
LLQDAGKKTFTMGSLWRLALWGAAAAAALTVVVLAGASDIGAQRLRLALAALADEGSWVVAAVPPPPPAPAQPSAEQQLAALAAERAAEAERQTRELTDIVQKIAADRDSLLTRLATLERSLEDVTGSIKRQTDSRPAKIADRLVPTPPTVAAPAAAPVPDMPPVPVVDAPAVQATASVPVQTMASAPAAQATANAPAAETPASIPIPTSRAETEAPATNPQPPAIPRESTDATAAPPPPPAPRAEIGVDLGGATSFEGLRARWNSARNNQPALLDGLRPIVFVRENRRTGNIDLRLIAGPLSDAAAAARVCAAFASVGRYCQPAVYDGQRLALR